MVGSVGLVALGCADGDARDDVLVRGRIERLEVPTSYNGPVTLGSDSVARIGLYAAVLADAPATLLVEQVLSPAPALPFEFALRGRPDPSSQAQHYVIVEVKQHSPAWTLGDLTSEEPKVIEPPADNVVIRVTGLQACDAPHEGDFCI